MMKVLKWVRPLAGEFIVLVTHRQNSLWSHTTRSFLSLVGTMSKKRMRSLSNVSPFGVALSVNV